jgi:hypothetical protein
MHSDWSGLFTGSRFSRVSDWCLREQRAELATIQRPKEEWCMNGSVMLASGGPEREIFRMSCPGLEAKRARPASDRRTPEPSF